MRVWPFLAVLSLMPAAAMAQRVPVPPEAEAALMARDYTAVGKIIEPLFDTCMADPDPRDKCLDIMRFLIRVADFRGDFKHYDELLALTLRYALLVLPPLDPEIADLRILTGDRLFTSEKYAEAEAVYREALASRRAAAPIDDDALDEALGNLEITLTKLEKAEEAYALATERVPIADRLTDPARRAQAARRVGQTLMNLLRYAEAETWLRTSAALDEQVGAPRRVNLLASLTTLSLSLFQQRKIREARTVASRALALATEIEGPGGESTLDLVGDVAIMNRDLGDFDAAEKGLRAGLALATANPATPLKVRLRLTSALGTVLNGTGRSLEAAELMSVAVEELVAASPAEQEQLTDVFSGYAVILADIGRVAEAEPILRRVLALRRATARTDDPDIARSLDTLGVILNQIGRREEAMLLHLEAVEMLMRSNKDDTTLTRNDLLINALGNLASTLVSMGRMEAAEPFQQQAVALARNLFPAGSPELATALNRWAYYRKEMGKCDALADAREARAIWAARAGAISPDRVIGDINLARYLSLCGGDLAEQRGYWRDASQYLLADASQSTGYDTRASGVLQERSIVFKGLVYVNWKLVKRAVRD